MRYLILIFICCFFTKIYSQEEYFNIRGYLTDESSQEVIINASVSLDSKKSVSTNNYGFFSFRVKKGEHNILFSAVGYKLNEMLINVTKDTILNVDLSKQVTTFSEIVIASKRKDLNVVSAQMGEINLSEKQIKSVPAFLGEIDLIKVYQYTPGVRNAGEGNAGFYVRGGGPDQNLILLDEATVYNVSHLFGFFSVFNADAINSTSLIKGGMPAQYGGRLSSVLNITAKEGNMREYKVDGGIGLISSRLSVQGPIKKDKASFIITGRRTYIDILTKPLFDNLDALKQFRGSGYYFYDVNAKANYKISKKDRIFISGYFGQDVGRLSNNSQGNTVTANISWGNSTLTSRWNHVYSKNLFSNLTAYFNRYGFEFVAGFRGVSFGFNSGIQDYGIKNDYEWFAGYNHNVKFGVQYTYHIFTPTTIQGRINNIDVRSGANQKFSNEYALYIQDDWNISDKWLVNMGLRYSAFQQIGPYDLIDPEAPPLDNIIKQYSSLENVVFYHALEPRLTFRYLFNDQSSVKLGLTKNNQYVHLVTTSGSFLPTDVWVPSSTRVKPQVGYLAALGYFRNFKNNAYETSVEIYYKHLLNQIEYREGYTPNNTRDPELDFVFGSGNSYGIELFIKKNSGDLTGWIGYTLSYTTRLFPDINNGKPFPSRFDRRHDFSLVLSYQFNERWTLGGTFVYATGNAGTIANSYYFNEGALTPRFGTINSFRLPAYHRADVGLTYNKPPKKPDSRFRNQWVFSIYNIYSRANPFIFFIDIQPNMNLLNPGVDVVPTQVALFPILPSVTWNFKF